MDLKSFEGLIKQENSARLFLVKSCWKNYRRFCIKCRGYKIYRIIGKRYRCKRCGYTFHDFSGRWINELHITPKQWLWVIKLFELELSAKKISEQITLSYPTVLKAVHMVRLAIVANSTNSDDLLKGKVEFDESYFGGRRKGNRGRGAFNKVPVFGILERNGVVKVDVKAETLLTLTVQTVRRGSIVYLGQI